MRTTFSRKAFLQKTLTGKQPVTAAPHPDPGNDPYFKKYANKTLPFIGSSVSRTQSGLTVYSGQWTELEALHLLRRLTFGTAKDMVDKITAMSVTDAVNLLIDNPQLPTTYPINVYNPQYADTQYVPFGESWVTYPGTNDSDSTLNMYRTKHSYKQWWAGLLLNQQPHILEKIALFWINHFSTQMEDFNYPKAIWGHFKTIRENCLGNFRTLLKAITIDPHMLLFLNGNLNSASAPDENYGRELQELFTQGKGTASLFTEDDVRAAARVLTGWRRQEQSDGFYTTLFDDSEHDSDDKQFSSYYGNTVIKGRSGQAGQGETDDLIQMLLGTQECAKYLCRCLYRWFVYYVIDDDTEANVISPLANILRDNNYDIVPVLKALFVSDHFFDIANRGCIIKSPVDFYIGFAREFKVQLDTQYVDVFYAEWDHFWFVLSECGQNLGDPPDVAGWPAYHQEPVYYESWISSDTIQKRTRVVGQYTSGGFPVDGRLIAADSLSFVQQFSNPGDPNKLIADCNTYLMPLPLTADQLTFLKQSFILTGQIDDSYWTSAWNNYVANPNDPMAKQTVQSRLDKLINYMTGMEEYQLY